MKIHEEPDNSPINKVSEPLSDEINTEEIARDLSGLKESKVEWLEIYKLIVDTRKFEIDNFWKRALFFWGTLTIVLVGYFGVKNDDSVKQYLIFISYLGLFYNLVFSFSIRGSKYWQENWEHLTTEYEKVIGFRLFRWKMKGTIRKENKRFFPSLRPHQYSVSKLTMILSDITVLFWFLLVCKDFHYLYEKSRLHFQTNCNCNIDWFTIAVIVVPLVMLIYGLIFLFWGQEKEEKKPLIEPTTPKTPTPDQ